jgi:hypothetical protein
MVCVLVQPITLPLQKRPEADIGGLVTPPLPALDEEHVRPSKLLYNTQTFFALFHTSFGTYS